MRRLVGLVGIGLCVMSSISACLTATEVVLEIQTNVDCEIIRSRGLVLHAGHTAGSVKSDAAVSRSVYFECVPGAGDGDFNTVGTLTLSPEAAKDAKFAVSGVIGIDKRSEDCRLETVVEKADDGTMVSRERFPGCVFTWRSTKFIKQTNLRMRMVLFVECKDVQCAPDKFCGAGARCYPGDVPADECKDVPRGCTGEPMLGTDASTDGNALADGSMGTDASRIDGSNTSDTGVPRDATVSDTGASDAPSDSGAGSTIACGVMGPPVSCIFPEICCRTSMPSCTALNACADARAVQACDDRSDCTAPEYCIFLSGGYGRIGCGVPTSIDNIVCLTNEECDAYLAGARCIFTTAQPKGTCRKSEE
jgi:hypothetical protein